MYDVLDVSRYIINYCNDNGYPISNLKLQKLLYFMQAFFLVNKNQPCFPNEIEAWPWGPVVRDAYFHYNWYGANNIPHTGLSITNISSDDQQKIDYVLRKLANLPAYSLVDITHSQAPWMNAFNNPYDKKISKESIKNYFDFINNHV